MPENENDRQSRRWRRIAVMASVAYTVAKTMVLLLKA